MKYSVPRLEELGRSRSSRGDCGNGSGADTDGTCAVGGNVGNAANCWDGSVADNNCSNGPAAGSSCAAGTGNAAAIGSSTSSAK